MTKHTIQTAEKAAPRKPDGTFTTRADGQMFVFDVFFNHEATETFQDKLLRVILAKEAGGLL